MERLLELEYANVVRLREQSRMAPALLEWPNKLFYAGELLTSKNR